MVRVKFHVFYNNCNTGFSNTIRQSLISSGELTLDL